MEYLYNTYKTNVISESIKIMLILLLVNFSLSAQNPGVRKGFYGSFNIGPGYVKGNIASDEKQTNKKFGMHISIGYFVNKILQPGITCSTANSCMVPCLHPPTNATADSGLPALHFL